MRAGDLSGFTAYDLREVQTSTLGYNFNAPTLLLQPACTSWLQESAAQDAVIGIDKSLERCLVHQMKH